jgi:hypothetical protein
MPCFDLIYDTAFKVSIRMPFFAMPLAQTWLLRHGYR